MEMLNTKPELVNRRQRLVSQFVKRTRVKKKICNWKLNQLHG